MSRRVLLVLYQLLMTLAVLLASPWLTIRSLRRGSEMRARLGLWVGSAPPPANALWIHAASLGELEAARHLLDAAPDLRARAVVTVTSTSALRRGHERLGSGIPIQAAPLDVWFAVARFLRHVSPSALVLLETELWPWTLAEVERGGGSLLALSARLSNRNWRRLFWARALFRRLLPRSLAVGAQSERDRARFRELGYNAAIVTGNLKYAPLPVRPHASASASVSASGARVDSVARTLWVIGSLRRGEESVLECLGHARPTVLAPRHLRERGHWRRALERRGLSYVLRSELGPEVAPLNASGEADPRARVGLLALLDDSRASVLLLDVHGELRGWYAVADAAYLGGTRVPIGGHSLFEPLAAGIPVALGSHFENVSDLVELARPSGCVGICATDAELRAWFDRMASDPEARVALGREAYRVACLAGTAPERTLRLLREVLGDSRPSPIPERLP